MTTFTPDTLRTMIAGATEGRRVQFHPNYCPEAKGAPGKDWDTSHDMSVIRPDGTRYRLATYRHASDAAISQEAVTLAQALLDALEREAKLREAVAIKAERTASLVASRDSGTTYMHGMADAFAEIDAMTRAAIKETQP